MNIIKKYLFSLINKSYEENNKNILSLLTPQKDIMVMDLGCDDGVWTKKIGKKIGTKSLFGIEVVRERIRLAIKNGISITESNLNEKLPLKSNSFDVVHSNQVIEHLTDTDMFVSEIYRVLKPGGYAIVSTENLSSWHNVFALIFGFQPFSMSNYSSLGNVGNPFALWNGKVTKNSKIKSWQHNRLFSYYGLKDIFEKHDFVTKKIITSGYYPLSGLLAKIDPIHGHWICIKIIKPRKK